MKIKDTTTGIIILTLYCCLFIVGLAGTLNNIFYKTKGIDDLIFVREVTKNNVDEFILSYTYFNKITKKSYLIERSIDNEQYENIKDKKELKIKYVSYFPMSPHIEGVDSKDPLLLIVLGLALLAFFIRRNIQFLKSKSTAEEFM